SVALGKAVFAKTLDLAEAAFGEVLGIAAPDHAVDELVAKELDRAGAPEGRHGAAQLVGLAGGKAGGDDGDLHRLLLEERHAEGALQNLLQFILRVLRRRRWILDLLVALAALQIGMDHVALDRA